MSQAKGRADERALGWESAWRVLRPAVRPALLGRGERAPQEVGAAGG